MSRPGISAQATPYLGAGWDSYLRARRDRPAQGMDGRRPFVHMRIMDLAGAAAVATPHDLLALPFFEGAAGPEPGPGTAEAARSAGADLPAMLGVLARQGFRGTPGDAATIIVSGDGPQRLAALGAGPAGSAGTSAVRDMAQRLAALAAGSASVATTLGLIGPDRPAAVRAAAEGFLLGAYRAPSKGSRPITGGRPAPPGALTLLTAGAPGTTAGDGDLRDALARGTETGDMANWVRDLVHTPAAEATPGLLAERIAADAAKHEATARIWTSKELAREGFGGVLGVGQGSRNPPHLVEITHAGPGGPPVALAGKGITFDSGGLNLKRDPGEISWMRADMAGGAAVAAAVIAAARLALPVAAVAVVPLAENMPGGNAVRPGDVLTHRDGRTSEVMDTDSEGRLVVADALAYLAERDPAALIDVATLTDAAGLGPSLWAALGTDAGLAAEVLRAGEAAGEPGWQLPLPAAYRDLLSSAAADLRNTPVHGPDSTVMAATFLREFTAGIPWVHIDNGSTAWLEYSTGLWPEGATGSPARALLRLLEGRADSA
jgi:leucyl aminopeptidase